MEIRRKKPRKLNLSNKNYDKFPSCVFNDKNIVYLDLSDNYIQEIPSNVGYLKKLRYLNLENNKIKELHNGILKLPALKEINLKGNPMNHLPKFLMENLHANIKIDKDRKTIARYIRDEEGMKLYNDINSEVTSLLSHKTIFEDTEIVPTLSNLTFLRNKERTGKTLESCVLFVDIRDSVSKNREYNTQNLAKMYSSFIYGVLEFAKTYGGHVRNIIGDRVMIVFDKKDCCYNAVKCANSIMYFVYNTMRKAIPDDNFDCGIGIHYGEMHIIKVGLTIRNEENPEYQNLIWMGDPANLASRLTDKAGKDNIPHIVISEEVYKRINDKSLIKGFKENSNNPYNDVDFKVYGKN